MSNELVGRKLLVTGGTGTIGNAVVERYLNTDISEIRVFSRDEKKQDEMRRRFNSTRIKYFIGDVRDPASLLEPMQGVDYVFHSAALKQVPSCEFFPYEAVKTNILGAENVFNSAIENSVSHVIALSTDKAVYPNSAMGMSKALMEKLMIAKSRVQSKTILCGTRYGNVLASSGSVVPLFIEQIKAGKELTVTDPSMTRFMMTIEEAVSLVVYAFEHGNTGDIFVKKSDSATILTIAEALKKILHASNSIKIIGARHGEKPHETLVTSEEMNRAEDCGGYFRIPADSRDLNYAACMLIKEQGAEYTTQSTHLMTVDEMAALLTTLEGLHA
jgi:UDP-glucose 4-epimerase